MGMFQAKKLEDWEEELLNSNNNNSHQHQQQEVDVKKEHSGVHVYGHSVGGGGGGVVGVGGGDDYHHQLDAKQNWSSPMILASSPQSCMTSFSSNMLDFSNNKKNSPPDSHPRHPPRDRSSEVFHYNFFFSFGFLSITKNSCSKLEFWVFDLIKFRAWNFWWILRRKICNYCQTEYRLINVLKY